MENRYYVQRLTEQVFLIRERLSQKESQDPITLLSDCSLSVKRPIATRTS